MNLDHIDGHRLRLWHWHSRSKRRTTKRKFTESNNKKSKPMLDSGVCTLHERECEREACMLVRKPYTTVARYPCFAAAQQRPQTMLRKDRDDTIEPTCLHTVVPCSLSLSIFDTHTHTYTSTSVFCYYFRYAINKLHQFFSWALNAAHVKRDRFVCAFKTLVFERRRVKQKSVRIAQSSTSLIFFSFEFGFSVQFRCAEFVQRMCASLKFIVF